MKIVPTILEKDFGEAERKIELVVDLVSWIQIDVIDGVFCGGKTFELELMGRMDFNIENKLFDIHLMVKEPIKWVNKCDFVKAARVIGQVEMMSNREKFVKTVKDTNMEAGLAIDIDSQIGEIPEETDVVLLMGRKAGFGGAPAVAGQAGQGEMDERIWKKIEILKQVSVRGRDREGRFEIGVDGGVNNKNIEKLRKAGVDIVYCGGAVFENGNVGDNLKILEQ